MEGRSGNTIETGVVSPKQEECGPMIDYKPHRSRGQVKEGKHSHPTKQVK